MVRVQHRFRNFREFLLTTTALRSIPTPPTTNKIA